MFITESQKKQTNINNYLNHKFMIMYDLVNDSKFDDVEEFLNDPENYGTGKNARKLNDHI